MKTLPKSAQIYIVSITLLALSLLLYFTLTVTIGKKFILVLLFFGTLSVFTESLKVSLPKGGFISVTFAVTYACLLLYGATMAAYVTIIGIIISKYIIKDKSPWFKTVFNCGQFVICVSVAHFVYIHTGGFIGKVNPLNILPLILSAGSYFILNHLALSLILSFVNGVSPWRMWITNLKWTLPNNFALLFLGVLMAGIYNKASYWGVSLIFGPLLLARYIFKSYMEVRQVYLNTLEALASSLDAKDKYTRGHSERVAKYAVEIAGELKLPQDQIETIEYTALLHDIGKIGVSAELLSRSGKLSVGEFDAVRLHPVIGANIVKEIHDLGAVTEFVLHHHEKYDGSGYPDNLHGEDIPLGARIITLADSFDAMTSGRSYRNELTFEEAVGELKRCAGTHFDPRLVEVFINCRREKVPCVQPNSLMEAVSAADK